jgi:hypothetical protein
VGRRREKMLTVNIEKRGDFYMAWHKDAQDIKSALKDVTLMKSGGADTIGDIILDKPN